MTDLVAGGAGFVGSHLCKRLLDEGRTVVCIDNLVTGSRANIAELCSYAGFTFIEADITEDLSALPQTERIFHLASPASPPAYQRFPVETLRVNSEGTLRLLDLAARDGARLLYASTSEVYGDPTEHPQRETYRGNVSCTGPRSMYDEAKRYGEALTMAYARDGRADTSIARIFNTYGPNMAPDDGRVVSNFIVQALRGRPLVIYGDGTQTRSFQYVDDLVEGLLRLLDSGHCEPVNLGNPEEYTVTELAHLVKELTGSAAGFMHRPLPADDPKQRRPDIAVARSLFNWNPCVPVREGLARTIEHFWRKLGCAGS